MNRFLCFFFSLYSFFFGENNRRAECCCGARTMKKTCAGFSENFLSLSPSRFSPTSIFRREAKRRKITHNQCGEHKIKSISGLYAIRESRPWQKLVLRCCLFDPPKIRGCFLVLCEEGESQFLWSRMKEKKRILSCVLCGKIEWHFTFIDIDNKRRERKNKSIKFLSILFDDIAIQSAKIHTTWKMWKARRQDGELTNNVT